MKKRMTILALLLAGAVTLGSYGMVQAGQEKREVPVAGVTQTLAQVLKEAGGVQAQTADAVEELQSNAAVARMMEPEMVAEEAWETAEIAENELPQTASEFADIAVAQVNHYVNVRQEPDTESEILGKLYDKSAATVLETTEDGWYRITSGNVNGYVKAEYVVVGAGINVYAPKGGFPPEIADIGGALWESPMADGKNKLAAEFLNRFWTLYRTGGDFLEDYRRRSLVIGKNVAVMAGGESKPARALDIDDRCRLRVRFANGEEQSLSYGEVRVVPAEPDEKQ